MEVCIAGDDARPPWNNASAILAKRMTECLAPHVKCYLASLDDGGGGPGHDPGFPRVSVGRTGAVRGVSASRLALGVRRTSADIVHIIGTNALVFSPMCGFLGGGKRILRHVFTSYDNNDRVVRPVRRFVNRLFIDGYAFTTPWFGEWKDDLAGSTREFVLRPPVNCELYKPGDKGDLFASGVYSDHTVLYMGPLLNSRFPAGNVLGALKMLAGRRIESRLVVLTSAERTSDRQVRAVTSLADSLGVADRLMVRRVDLTEAERVDAYSEADVVIFPFLGPVPEKLADPPFGMLEAMACGRIVLGTRVLSVPEVVEDGRTGFVAGDASSGGLCNGLSRALTAESREEIEHRAREKIVNEFSYSVVSRKALEVYETILADSHS